MISKVLIDESLSCERKSAFPDRTFIMSQKAQRHYRALQDRRDPDGIVDMLFGQPMLLHARLVGLDADLAAGEGSDGKTDELEGPLVRLRPGHPLHAQPRRLLAVRL